MGTEVRSTGIRESNPLPSVCRFKDTGSILSKEDSILSRLAASIDKMCSPWEAITCRTTLNQIEFDKQIPIPFKKHRAIYKEANKPLSTPLLAEICEEILKTLLENNTVSSDTVQQLLLFYDRRNSILPAQFKKRKLFCDEYEWNPPVQSEKHEMHKALAERSYPPFPGAPCDDGNHAPVSTRMPMKLPSNDPASVGVSSDDDDPNDIENPRDGNGDLKDDDPNDIENPRDGNRDLEDADPNDIENPRDGNRDLEDDDPNDENLHDGNGDLEAMHNLAIPKEVLLMFALQSFQILSTAKSNDISLLSREAEILQYCAEALTVIGFFCGLGVILLRNHRNLRAATKIMSRIGFYVTVLGFIATLCVPLGKFMFWILGFIGLLFSALYAYALWKGWIV